MNTYSEQRQRGRAEQGVVFPPGCRGRPWPRKSVVPHASHWPRQKQVFGRQQLPVPKTLDLLLLYGSFGFLPFGRLLAFVPKLYHLDAFVISVQTSHLVSHSTSLRHLFHWLQLITSLLVRMACDSRFNLHRSNNRLRAKYTYAISKRDTYAW